MKAESLGGAQIRTAFCSVSGRTCDTVTSSHSLEQVVSSDVELRPDMLSKSSTSHLCNSSWKATSAAKALSNGVRSIKFDGRSQCCNSVSLKNQTECCHLSIVAPRL